MVDQSQRAVVVSGLGLVCSIGHDRDDQVARMRAMRHGFARTGFPSAGLSPITVAAPVPGFDVAAIDPAEWTWPNRYPIDPAELRSLPPHGLYALAAVHDALAEAGLTDAPLDDGRTGLFCASAGSPRVLHHYLGQAIGSQWRRAHPLGVVRTVAGTLNFNLAARFGITGSVCGFASACASGAHALGHAMDEILLGRQDRVLVVAGEEFSAESLLPFAGMQALSLVDDPDHACRPFDRNRDGFAGTGGAAAVLLEEAGIARARGCRPLARLLAWAQAADGHHVAMPEPEGDGLRRAMDLALAAAGLTPDQIDAVSAHATSTPAGDRAEAIALRRVFTERGLAPAITAFKSLVGHGLSFAGAMETAMAVLCLRHGFLPGIAGLRDPDPICAGLDLVRTTRDCHTRILLKNTSGFGGSNVCLLLAQPE